MRELATPAALYLAAGLALAAAAATLSASAQSGGKAPPVAVIASVNMAQVVQQMDEKTKLEEELKGYFGQLQTELTNVNKEIEDIQQRIRMAAPGMDTQPLAVQLLEAQARGEMRQRVSERLFEQRKGQLFGKLYARINDAAKRMAERNGYTMVLASDAGPLPVPANGPSDAIQQAISQKRLLHISPGHDITAELVTMLNAEHKANPNAPVPTGAFAEPPAPLPGAAPAAGGQPNMPAPTPAPAPR